MPFCADLFYRYYDGGPSSFVYPTIFLHGLGGTHLSWPHSLRRIPGQRVYALDLPGHGLSEIAARCSVHSLATDLQRFTSGLGFFYFALVGHSLGSAVAFEFARLFPQQIRGLALISFGREFSYMKEIRSFFDSERTRQKAIDLLSQKGFYAKFPRSLRQEILSPLNKIRLSVLQADLGVCSSFLANCSVENFLFPVQLISGRDDQLVPLIEVKKLKYYLPNASLKIINECGHMAIFEQTDTARTTLQDFLIIVTKPDY
ncbi:MAG: alpha/beta hydrolase [Pelolinea sp.]|nr:alpha/beta hydrolase [Pelolinea sp.]